MLKIPMEYNRDTSLTNLTDISRQVSPALLLDISADIFQRALADEPGMIRTQMGTHDRSIVAVHGTLCTIPLATATSKQ
jgi:hypothetical protein